jgi:hypothetical protein
MRGENEKSKMTLDYYFEAFDNNMPATFPQLKK